MMLSGSQDESKLEANILNETGKSFTDSKEIANEFTIFSPKSEKS